MLDVESETGTLGKKQGVDAALDKPTYPSILGIEASRAHARALHERASERLAPFGHEADFLCALSEYVVTRVN